MSYELKPRLLGEGFWIMGTAAETLGNRQLVYLDANTQWRLADADVATKMPVIGMTMQPIGVGLRGQIFLMGFIGDSSWAWTPGGAVYASSTPGVLTQTQPSGAGDVVQRVGTAYDATMIYFDLKSVDMGENRYAEAHISAGGAITVDTTDIWHAVTGFVDDDVRGITFNDGGTGAITAFADAGGGQVTVTSAAHGLSNGYIVTIAGTTNYNGIFEVSNVAVNTFEITDTWVANDATGTWRNGSNFVITVAAVYLINWQISASAAIANKIFTFTISIGDIIITAGLQRRKFAAGGDVGAVAGSFLATCSVGDIIAFNLMNETDATNITIEQATINIHSIA